MYPTSYQKKDPSMSNKLITTMIILHKYKLDNVIKKTQQDIDNCVTKNACKMQNIGLW